MKVTTQKAEGSVELLEETKILSNYFRTSKYNKFTDKVDKLFISVNANPWNIAPGVENLLINCKDRERELFDTREYKLEAGSTMRIVADYENTNWFKNVIEKNIYDEDIWKFAKLKYKTPNLNVVELHRLINKSTIDEDGMVDKSNVSSMGAFRYVALNEINEDYNTLRTEVASAIVNANGNISKSVRGKIEKFENFRLPLYSYGKYPVKLQYILPGEEKSKSSGSLTFNYE
jgi:hypothetical protein